MIEERHRQGIIRLPNGQEMKVRRLTKEDVNHKLAKLEAKHRMTSQEFVKKWNRGKLDCAVLDYFDWAAYCLMAYKQGRAELQVED